MIERDGSLVAGPSVDIMGEIVNKTGREYVIVTFSVSIYDSSGNIIAIESIYIYNITQNQIKTFKTHIYDITSNQIIRCKIQLDQKS